MKDNLNSYYDKQYLLQALGYTILKALRKNVMNRSENVDRYNRKMRYFCYLDYISYEKIQ